MHTSRRAFTLVELCTTICILAILCALISGGLGNIRKAGENAGCVSNLRAIGAAVSLYASDHDGALPGPAYGNMPATYSYSLNGPYTLTTYLAPYLDCPAQENTTQHTCPTMICPAFKYRNVLPSSQWVRARSYTPVYQLTGVTLPGGMLPNPWGRPATAGLNMNDTPLKLATVATLVKPSATWMIMDADVTSNIGGDGLAPKPVHGTHWNRLYFDFHVEATSNPKP